MKILAPGKINLGLQIVGLRPDGYHELDSLFLPLDLADELEVASKAAGRTTIELQVEGQAPGDASNLAVRAAQAFVDAGEGALQISIRLCKHTPMAAGLGGGSSDAAAVLRALAQLHPDRVATSRLAELGLGLGADVPFFLDPRPTRVQGIGEQRTPAPGVTPLSLVLANPGEAVSTVEAYRAFDTLGGPLSPGLGSLPDLSNLAARDPDTLASLLRNDLEPAALRLCPAIGRVRAELARAGAVAVGLSGSGATLYGLCRDPAHAEEVAGRLHMPNPGWCRVAIAAESR